MVLKIKIHTVKSKGRPRNKRYKALLKYARILLTRMVVQILLFKMMNKAVHMMVINVIIVMQLTTTFDNSVPK
jgi:hypothetical protein